MYINDLFNESNQMDTPEFQAALLAMKKRAAQEPPVDLKRLRQRMDAQERAEQAREKRKQERRTDVDENAWSDGTNDWSSEHDQWAKESSNNPVPVDSASAIPGRVREGAGVFNIGDQVLYKGQPAEVLAVDGTAATVYVPNWKAVPGMVDDTMEVDPASKFLNPMDPGVSEGVADIDELRDKMQWLMTTYHMRSGEAEETAYYDKDPATWKGSPWEDEYTGVSEEFDPDNNPWQVTDVDPMSETDFEVVLQGPGGQQLNFVIRPIDFMETQLQRYQIDTMDVRDLQTGKTMHWGSMNDLGQWLPIFDAIDTYFWESPALQARLEKIISYYMDAGEQGKNPDMMPGLDQRDPNGVAVSADDFIASYDKTQDAMSKMKKGVAEGKKRSDRYHIVGKDGNPASLASYADQASAVKDRDAKYPDAKVHQVGPRGKVKGEFEEGVAEGNYWHKLQAERNTKINSLIEELKESIK